MYLKSQVTEHYLFEEKLEEFHRHYTETHAKPHKTHSQGYLRILGACNSVNSEEG